MRKQQYKESKTLNKCALVAQAVRAMGKLQSARKSITQGSRVRFPVAAVIKKKKKSTEGHLD